MYHKQQISGLIAGLLTLPACFAASSDHHHHDSYIPAPIGVMGDHIHPKGEWMVSYRYMHMEMDDMRDGTDDLDDSEVLADFMVTPTKMTTDTHMFSAMYAVTSDLTLMTMMPWIKKSMDHVTRMGVKFTTGSEGIGDLRVGGLYSLKRWNHQQVHLNLGVSIPTGDIDENDTTPAMRNARLPYPMQLGSGTWDALPGITYNGQMESYSWGGQALATLRISDNDNNYTLGDRLELTGWGAYGLSSEWSTSARMRWQTWGNIDGDDNKLNRMVVPTADPDLQGGTRADALLGLSYSALSGFMKGNRFAVEGGIPVYENLDGPQMSAEWMITAGWQLIFD